MRRPIVHEGAGQLTYEIRGIVALAKALERAGITIIWENIGDPVQKGEPLPQWMKDIISSLVTQDKIYGYSDTQGVSETRTFLAERVNSRGGCRVTQDDIMFFNGLGDAVARIFGFLRREARVIGPSPAYSTHSSAEAAHSGYEHLTYDLNPADNWMPDLDDLEKKIKYNDSISGMLVINPDNPTGAVYPRKILEGMIAIAKRHGVFVIFDEIYASIVYNNAETASLSEIIDDRPGLALRGISKEFPWPGARCGWIEIFNQDKYPEFKEYIQSIINIKMLEVCSTSLPQYAIPPIMGDPRYPAHLDRRSRMFEARANTAYRILSSVDGIHVVQPRGAFYMTILFNDGVLNQRQSLEVDNPAARQIIETAVQGVEIDKRFVYYLLAATGICVVPLTGFCCLRNGFRVTLLEPDDEQAEQNWNTIAAGIKRYLASAS
ncbi:MAG: pyridoxal phosphate-dependent aminotransferase [Deltaproteobacteria bacterium]|nr:pyridoxal phosphate-dependent aminotransferase [Deltaproteobacteria bacterium]